MAHSQDFPNRPKDTKVVYNDSGITVAISNDKAYGLSGLGWYELMTDTISLHR